MIREGSGQITKGLLSHLCGRCADRAPAAEGRTAQAKPSLLRPSANLKKDDQKVVFEDLNLLIQGVISSLFPLSLPHTGIGQRHGQREKRQGEEAHPDRTSSLKGASPCYRRERFPVLSHCSDFPIRCEGLLGPRGLTTIRRPHDGARRLASSPCGSKRLPAADDQAADAHRRSSDRADVAVAPTRFRRTTTSSLPTRHHNTRRPFQGVDGGRDRSLSVACSRWLTGDPGFKLADGALWPGQPLNSSKVP